MHSTLRAPLTSIPSLFFFQTILFLLAANKIAVAFFQLPHLEDTMLVASSTKQSIEIGLAALGFVAWGMPRMSMKSKTNW